MVLEKEKFDEYLHEFNKLFVDFMRERHIPFVEGMSFMGTAFVNAVDFYYKGDKGKVEEALLALARITKEELK